MARPTAHAGMAGPPAPSVFTPAAGCREETEQLHAQFYLKGGNIFFMKRKIYFRISENFPIRMPSVGFHLRIRLTFLNKSLAL